MLMNTSVRPGCGVSCRHGDAPVPSTICRSAGSELMMEEMKESSLSITPSLSCSC